LHAIAIADRSIEGVLGKESVVRIYATRIQNVAYWFRIGKEYVTFQRASLRFWGDGAPLISGRLRRIRADVLTTSGR
jgi:hypothetical protein